MLWIVDAWKCLVSEWVSEWVNVLLWLLIVQTNLSEHCPGLGTAGNGSKEIRITEFGRRYKLIGRNETYRARYPCICFSWCSWGSRPQLWDRFCLPCTWWIVFSASVIKFQKWDPPRVQRWEAVSGQLSFSSAQTVPFLPFVAPSRTTSNSGQSPRA